MRETAETPQQGGQVLAFTAGGAHYGIPILKVREILQYESVTEVPGAPASVLGVANVRGTIVPVLDLAAKLGRAGAAATKRSCILVVDVSPEGERYTLGVFADTVNEVVDLRAKDVEPPPAFGGTKVPFLVGLGKPEKGLLLLIDLDRVLTAPEAELAAEVASSGAGGCRGVRSLA